jgi:CRISPR-associated protein Cmr2
MFDGDNMGEWLSGKETDEKRLQEFHRFLSLRLLEFAQEVKKLDKIVTVYAGGEDFLGFINLNYLFESLLTLRKLWNEKVNDPLKSEFDIQKNMTFSAGVTVAHYKTPLNEVLKNVREAEKKAKNTKGKNTVCFRVLKRSGEVREAVLKYEKLNDLPYIMKRLKTDFSDNFISTLEREFEIFDAEYYMIEAELKRLLQRAKLNENAKIEDLHRNIMNLLEINEFDNFIQTLQILKFLKREIR